jgi:hypothetical protein
MPISKKARRYPRVRARAVVRDSQASKGMGIEFTSMGQDARARLHRLMKTLTRVSADREAAPR